MFANRSRYLFSVLSVVMMISLALANVSAAGAFSLEPASEYPKQTQMAGTNSPATPYVKGVVLVGLKSGTSLESSDSPSGKPSLRSNSTGLSSKLEALNVRDIRNVFPSKPAKAPSVNNSSTLANTYRLKLDPTTDIPAAVLSLSSDPSVLFAEPDYLAQKADAPNTSAYLDPIINDPQYNLQWGLAKINIETAWAQSMGSPSVVIAVIDSGIDLTQIDLAAHLWVNPGEIPGNGLDDDNNGYVDDTGGWNFVAGSNDLLDDNGHGTTVAGVAAAIANNGQGIAGVCPLCTIMPIKVMQFSGAANYSDIAAGILYAAQKGARVINLSLGGYANSNTLRNAIDTAVNMYGAVVVAGAGNDTLNQPFYPAAYENVLAVAGTTEDDTKLSSSNYASWVDISAPAVNIRTTALGGDWVNGSGTSMAAPFASGLAGLLRTLHPDWSQSTIRSQIVHTADPIDGLNPTYAGLLGSGRINAAHAVSVVPQSILSIKSTAINGDPSSRPDPGTAATLQVTLVDDWMDVSAVQGTLTTSDAYVTITTGSASFGDIRSGASQTGSPVFGFTIASGAGYNHAMAFVLHLSANDGDYTLDLPLTITTRTGDTPANGTINVDTTWTSDKIYIINNNVGIAPGKTLTIQPGTTVKFNGNYSLNVGGTLVADGTQSQPIRLMSNTSGDWGQIYFDDSSQDASADASGIYQSGDILRWVQITNASTGIVCNNASPYLSHVTLDGGGINCTTGGTELWLSNSDLVGNVQVNEGSGGAVAAMGYWTVRASMPTARAGLGVAAAANGKLYAIGGGGGETTVEAYDPGTNTWAVRASMPTARVGLGVVAASNGKIYAIGGNNGSSLATVEEYDPIADTWQLRMSMPTARGYLAVAAAPNGKIYAIGGSNDSGILGTVEEYDPIADSWRPRASIPTTRERLGAAATPDGKLYAIGGFTDNIGTLATVEEYNPDTDTWSVRANMPTVHRMLGVVAVPNGRIYAIGGASSASLSTLEEYDPVTNNWATRPPMLTPHEFPGAAVAENGKIYVMGGYSQSAGTLSSVEEYTLPSAQYYYHVLQNVIRNGNLSLPYISEALSNTIIGGQISAETGSLIQGNDIQNAPSWAIRTSGMVTIDQNRLNDNANGIQTFGGIIQGNLIANITGTGLEINGNTTVSNNTFTTISGSAIQLVSGAGGSITSNNFDFNSGAYDIEDLVPITNLASIPATGNWWGATDTDSIDGRIFDFNDDYHTGIVDYAPAAGGPIQTAPAYVRSVEVLPDTTLGIQTGTFVAEFSRPMDTSFDPQITFALPSNENWVMKASMHAERYNLGVVAASNGKVYAMGGSGAGNIVEEYDPATDTWATRATMPTSRSGMGLATGSNGKIYAVGGAGSGVLNTMDEYDPATDTWATRAPMPTERSDFGLAAASNGRLYAIGGLNNTGFLATVEEYDPATDTWATRAPMPTARHRLGVVAASNGKIYAIGGYGGLTTVEEYDPLTNTWRKRADMPNPRSGLGVAVTEDGLIYAIGGYPGEILVDAYDPATNTWTAKASLHKGRDWLGAATASNGKIYAIGGVGDAVLVTNEEYTPANRGTQAVAGNPAWLDPTHFRASYDFTSLNPKGSYLAGVSGSQTADGMAIAPNSVTSFTLDYAGFVSDTTPPTKPVVIASGTGNLTSLSSNWSSHDPESAITQYRYGIGTASGTRDVVAWTYISGATTTITRSGLNLTPGQAYYVTVGARNEGGLWSEEGVSNAVIAGEVTTFSLNIGKIGSGSVTSNPAGIDCGVDCSEDYNAGAHVTLTATAATGSTFINWSESSCPGTDPCVVTMDAAKSITATFIQNEYTLTVISEHGAVARDPIQSTYHEGDLVHLTATPDTGWSFTNWTGGLTSTTNPDYVTIHGNTSVTANYAQNEYTLTIISEHGTVLRDPIQATYHEGDLVHLTATPATGWSFVNWNGGLATSVNPDYVTIHGNTSVTANYIKSILRLYLPLVIR